MAIPARITVATLGAYDMPAMRAFYRALGWRETKTSSDGFASFKLDGAILALFPFDALAKDGRIPPGDLGTAFRGVTLAINVESAAVVDRTIAELRETGATNYEGATRRSVGRPVRLLHGSRGQSVGGRLGAQHLR